MWRDAAEKLQWLYRMKIDEEVDNSIGRCEIIQAKGWK